MEDVLMVLVVHGEDCSCDTSSETSSDTKLKVNSNAYRQGWDQIFGSKQETRTLH